MMINRLRKLKKYVSRGSIHQARMMAGRKNPTLQKFYFYSGFVNLAIGNLYLHLNPNKL